jgi:hypothetical protein
MSKPIYTDAGTDYPELMQPQGIYVAEAEVEFDGQEVRGLRCTHAWELQEADEE